MITSAIAKRYAKALVQLGVEDGAVGKYHDELIGFEAVWTANPELKAIFTSPAYGINTKLELLKGVQTKLALSPLVCNFLCLLLERSRLGFLSDITACYGILADELSGVVRPTLTTAIPLEDQQVEGIRDALAKATGKKVILSVAVDSALLGGVVAHVGDKVFDGSVRNQLNRLQDILQKG